MARGGAARAPRAPDPDEGTPNAGAPDAAAAGAPGKGPPAAPAARRGARAAPARAAELDGVIHERMRLGIVSALAVHPSLAFTDLRDLLGASDGNLSVHARKLEDAGYVACEKSFNGRVPKTEYRLTDLGRAALTRYLDHMEALIRATRPR